MMETFQAEVLQVGLRVGINSMILKVNLTMISEFNFLN